MASSAARALPSWLIVLMAAACGLSVANLYYAQPLAGPISRALGMAPAATGLVVTLTQVGYGLGLLLLVPLGDLIENRGLIFWTALAAAAALVVASFAPTAPLFLIAALMIGVFGVAAQMLVPVAAHLASDEARGRVVGEVMSGLLAGILLSRPAASLIADHLGWRAVFQIAAGLTVAMALVLRRFLPQRQPQADHTYLSLLASMSELFRGTPILRRRAAYQTFMFAAFSLFWTVVPLWLAGPTYGFNQTQIALFALAGATGALIAPVAGRIADRGWTRPASGAAFVAAALCFVLCWVGRHHALWALVGAGLLLDLGVQASQVLGQRAIYSLGAAERSRLNSLYVSIFFVGGATGSGAGAAIYAWGGWVAASGLGLGFCVVALLIYTTEFFGPSVAPTAASVSA
jgi:predicted MFS family arabinose efflux permease